MTLPARARHQLRSSGLAAWLAVIAAGACAAGCGSSGDGGGSGSGGNGGASSGSGGTGGSGSGGSGGGTGTGGSGGAADAGRGGSGGGSGGSGGSGGADAGAGDARDAAATGAGGSGGAAPDAGGADVRDGAVPDATSGDARGDATDGTVVRSTWDWAGIVGTGQSLSVGAEAQPARATTQPYGNLKLSLGSAAVPPFDPANGQLAMVALVEPIRAFATTYPSAYPRNIYGETPHTAMANQITALARRAGGDYVSVHTVVGESGQPMSVIRKGATEVVTGAMTMGRAYAATLFEVAAVARLARAAGKTYGVGAIVITHGEADTGSPTYQADLVRLRADYAQDLTPLTGQTARILMLVNQQHSVPTGLGQRSAATQAQWRVGVDNAADFVCTGPKYQYTYAADNVHLNALEYQKLGEKTGQVYHQRVVLGNDWQPLQPVSASRAARVITVRFHVPVLPLVWDAVLPQPHQTALTQWAAGRGFEVRAGATNVAISSVAISGDSVVITCATDLPATGVVVGYAQTADGTQRAGGTARWGQLRDSDPFVGATTNTAQPNFAVAFEMPVP